MKARTLIVLASLASGSPAAADGGGLLHSVEVNPLRLMLSASNHIGEGEEAYRSATGTINFNTPFRRVEVSVPLAVVDDRRDIVDACCAVRKLMADVQLRFFRGDYRTGFYAGPLIKFLRIRGTEATTGGDGRFDRTGLGLVLGYRLRPSNTLLWGFGVSGGRFLDETFELERSGGIFGIDNQERDGAKGFLYIEALKFGYKF